VQESIRNKRQSLLRKGALFSEATYSPKYSNALEEVGLEMFQSTLPIMVYTLLPAVSIYLGCQFSRTASYSDGKMRGTGG